MMLKKNTLAALLCLLFSLPSAATISAGEASPPDTAHPDGMTAPAGVAPDDLAVPSGENTPPETLPDDGTAAVLRANDLEISRIKAQTARQDALNALEESRHKATVIAGSGTVTPSPAPSPALSTPQPQRSPALLSSQLLEIWSERGTLRAAVARDGRRVTLQAGDAWPGTRHTVKSITARGVTLDNDRRISPGDIF